ncbi:MAG: hypothetical protein IKP12_02655 [Acholeplasmatales bacterium]|nr:hypothetical protein [Acholeplasmatales bacterium]
MTNNKKDKREYKYNAHGLSICEYVSNGKVELWLKVLFYIVHWYLNPKHKNQAFFQKYSTIKKVFNKWGCECTEDGIEEAFRRLKASDLDLIKVEYNELTKAEFVANGGNPNHYIYRKVFVNWKRLNKYMQVFTNSSHTLKELKNKSRLKKLVYKRYMSYTDNLKEIFKKAMEETSYEKYRSEKAMYLGWIVLHSSHYYKSNIINESYIPTHAINLRKAQDKEALDEAIKLALEKNVLSNLDGDNPWEHDYPPVGFDETMEQYNARCKKYGWEMTAEGHFRNIKDGFEYL